MSRVNDFHSFNETSKHPVNRVYHNNGYCSEGHEIPESERRTGTGGFRLCDVCAHYHQQDLRERHRP